MKKVLLSCAALIAAFSAPVGAQAFTPIGTVNGLGPQFWNNGSTDGTGCNIGYILTNANTSACGGSNQKPAGWLPLPASYGHATAYWNNANAWSGFLVGGAGTFTVSFIGGVNPQPAGGYVAGKTPEVWGWFDYTTGTRHDLAPSFVSSSTTSIVTSGPWGLFLQTTDLSYRYSTIDPQFSAFTGTFTGIDFGLEDIYVPSGNSDADYNDVVFNVQGTDGKLDVVPEPASMTLLATGLAGMAAAGLRRRRNRK